MKRLSLLLLVLSSCGFVPYENSCVEPENGICSEAETLTWCEPHRRVYAPCNRRIFPFACHSGDLVIYHSFRPSSCQYIDLR